MGIKFVKSKCEDAVKEMKKRQENSKIKKFIHQRIQLQKFK